MSKNEPKSLSQLISSANTNLGRLAAEAQAKLDLTEHIRTGFDAEIAAEISHCALDSDDVMIVRATSPAWAARLRFENTKLLELSRERYPQTISVKVRVAQPD